MLLDGHYAVVWHPTHSSFIHKEVVDAMQWVDLSRRASEGHVVIQECWDITSGKCISN